MIVIKKIFFKIKDKFFKIRNINKEAIVFFHNFLYSLINMIFYESDVEFYLVDSFEIFHFIPIYNKYIMNGYKAYFILEKPIYNVSNKWFDYENAISIVQKNKLKYRRGCNNKCKLVFTTQRSDILIKYNNAIKVSVSYGIGFIKNYFNLTDETCKGFDYRLVHGEYMKSIQKKYMNDDHLLIMGYPKHYQEVYKDRNELMSELNISTNKRIIMYYPTWDEDCSVDKLYDFFKELKNEYYIITKMHHCLDRLDYLEEKRKKIYEFSDCVLEGNYNFLNSAILASDEICIVDAKSGASTEIPYLNNKVKLILFTIRENINDYFLDEIFTFAPITNSVNELRRIINDYIPKNGMLHMEKYYGNKDHDYLEDIMKKLDPKHTN